MKTGKKYRAVRDKVNPETAYSLAEAVKLATETSITKFDGTVELHMNLNVDVRHADQIVRGTVSLPHGTGKKVRIAAFVESDKVKACLEAGADIAGLDDLIESVKKGEINFDIAVAEPRVMKNLGVIAKVLGPKGLMPSPKAGTVAENIVKVVQDIKKGQVEYKTDKTGIIHCIAGKVSFGPGKIEENVQVLVDAILAAKPAAVKGTYIKSVFVTTTMGPGIRVDIASLQK